MLQYSCTQIMHNKNVEDVMDNKHRWKEETVVVRIGEGFPKEIFEQVSRMLSLPGRKMGETTF